MFLQVEMWERMTVALASLGPTAMEVEEGDSEALGDASQGQLVEYEGMLVSVAAAQRRRFFSSLIQRAAKVRAAVSASCLIRGLGTPGSDSCLSK